MPKEAVAVAGPYGKANSNYFLDSASGAFGKATLSQLDDVKKILDAAASQKPKNGLVLHFHGGLNSRQYALTDIVPRLSKHYLNAETYPLFFVWQSGLKEALINNQSELLKDPTFRELVKKVAEWTLKKVDLNGNVTVKGSDGTLQPGDEKLFREQFDEFFDSKDKEARPPVPDDNALEKKGIVIVRNTTPDAIELEIAIRNQLEAELDPDFNRAIGEAYNASITLAEVMTKGAGTGTTKRAENFLLSEIVLKEIFPPEPGSTTKGFFTWLAVARYVTRIVLAVVARYRNHRDHGIYCTVVEEVLRSAFLDLVGSNVWNQMKNDTLDSFKPGEFCGTAVVEKLRALEDSGNGFEKLTLVGHSTGAIYICNFLDAAKAAGLSFKKIQVIFLAPALTCSRFASAINTHGAGYLKNFRMFAMRDNRESDDKLVPIIYTRSLLYFVSGLLEGQSKDAQWKGILDMPIVGMERFIKASAHGTFQGDADVQSVITFLEGGENRTVWSPSLDTKNGMNSDSKTHGDFDNDDATLKSVTSMMTG